MSAIASNKSLWVGLGGAAAGAAVVWTYQEMKKRQQYAIPKELARSPYASELKLAIKMALRAGQNMVPHSDTRGTSEQCSEEDLGINTKGQPEDFATAIDLQNERYVIDSIKQQFPSHKIIGEEESAEKGAIAPLTNDKTWIIDPIDGTTNFASGLPMTCVSIGFCDGGKAQMGVVFAPMTNELYLGVRGYGSYRNGKRITSRSSGTPTPLSSAVVNYEFGYARSPKSIDRMVSAVRNLLQHGCRTTRTIGSGVLDICYVATGRLDVVYAGVADEGWKPWDYCAGYVVATEAGCAMEALVDPKPEGEEFDLYSKSILCATSKELCDETREVVLKNLV